MEVRYVLSEKHPFLHFFFYFLSYFYDLFYTNIGSLTFHIIHRLGTSSILSRSYPTYILWKAVGWQVTTFWYACSELNHLYLLPRNLRNSNSVYRMQIQPRRPKCGPYDHQATRDSWWRRCKSYKKHTEPRAWRGRKKPRLPLCDIIIGSYSFIL